MQLLSNFHSLTERFKSYFRHEVVINYHQMTRSVPNSSPSLETSLLPVLCFLVTSKIHPDKELRNREGGGKGAGVKGDGTQQLIYFYSLSQQTLLSSFILLDICVLRRSG